LPEELYINKLDNGLTILGQQIPNVTTTAFTAIVPCGASFDPSGMEGIASIAGEWFMRGAGDHDVRGLNDALDALGCQHSISTGNRHMSFSSLQLGRNLPAALDIFAEIIRRPRFEDRTFEPCRSLIEQDTEALEDEPARKTRLVLRERFFPFPLGRNTLGTAQSVAGLHAADARDHICSYLAPEQTIIGVAGNVDFDDLGSQLTELFDDWAGTFPGDLQTAPPEGGTHHIEKDTAQTHIATAHPAPIPDQSDHYYPARVVEAILSHGMGSRLFVEVREKRGLAYHVSAGYSGIREAAGMFTYAGTRPETARETLDILVDQLRKAGDNITDDELSRAKTQIRSALIMQGQSSASRAGAIVADWYNLSRIRSLEEISEAIQGVTQDSVKQYVENFPVRDLSVVTIGPDPVNQDNPAG